MVPATYKSGVRVTAVLAGFFLSYVAGAKSIFVVLFGLMFAAFLVVAVWRASAALIPPTLTRSNQGLTTLDINGK